MIVIADHSRLGFGAALVVESTNQFSNLESQYTLPSDRLVKTLEQPVYSDVYSVSYTTQLFHFSLKIGVLQH